MIRRALFDAPASDSLLSAASVASGPPLDRHTNSSTTKLNARVGTLPLDLTSTLDHPFNDTTSDDNLCPVCGVDLLKLYVQNVRLTGCESSHSDYEAFKEAHISDCLVTYDFANNHQRLASPPGGSSNRNRMLVYNIPPFPKPSYEIIDVHQSTSVDTLPQHQEQVCGLVNSSSTVQLEKDITELECVICLDELKPGDKVGRLECLCVFHYKCIKDWFNKKGYGECPVHFMHH